MSYEKSCGAVIWRSSGRGREYLIILNRKGNAPGHWGFPKGHVEKGETEQETARREIREETGLEVQEFIDGFRTVNSYSPRDGVNKDAVYFLANADGDIIIQSSELADYRWCTYDEALGIITHDGKILEAAERCLNGMGG